MNLFSKNYLALATVCLISACGGGGETNSQPETTAANTSTEVPLATETPLARGVAMTRGDKVNRVLEVYAVFGLTPDISGINYWVDSGDFSAATVNNIMDAAASSKTWMQASPYQTNEYFAKYLYTNTYVLDDASGATYWGQEADRVGRAQMVVSFLDAVRNYNGPDIYALGRQAFLKRYILDFASQSKLLDEHFSICAKNQDLLPIIATEGMNGFIATETTSCGPTYPIGAMHALNLRKVDTYPVNSIEYACGESYLPPGWIVVNSSIPRPDYFCQTKNTIRKIY